MQTCPNMQHFILCLAARFGMDLNAEEAHLKLVNEGYLPLAVEKVGKHLLSVAHYAEEGGDLIPDPEVVLFTGYSTWVPIEIAQRPPGGYRVYAEVSADGKSIARLDPAGQAELAHFVERWANNLAAQGWLDRAFRVGKKEEPPQAEVLPRLEHLGASCWIAQASFDHSRLYHAVLLGHQTALKALRAAFLEGKYLYFPLTGQIPLRPYPPFPTHHGVCRAEGLGCRSRITGDRERGLYAMAIWTENRELLEKERSFYLVDPDAFPVPIPDEHGRRALPRPSEEILRRFHAWLNEALLTPLLPKWAGELWDRGSRTPSWAPLVRPLLSLGCAAWLVSADEERWGEIVREIVRG